MAQSAKSNTHLPGCAQKWSRNSSFRALRDTTKSDITLNHMLLFQSRDPKVSTEEWKILKPPLYTDESFVYLLLLGRLHIFD